MNVGDKVTYYGTSGHDPETYVSRDRKGYRYDIVSKRYGHVQFVPLGTGPGMAAPEGWEPHHSVPVHDGRPALLPPEPMPLPVEKVAWWKVAALVVLTAAATEGLHLAIAHFVR